MRLALIVCDKHFDQRLGVDQLDFTDLEAELLLFCTAFPKCSYQVSIISSTAAHAVP